MSPTFTTQPTTLRTAKHTFILLGLLVMTLSSCTNLDPEFGNDFIPPSQQMGSAMDSTIGIKTFVSKFDSVQTSGLSITPHVGSVIDPYVGRTEISFFASYAPKGFNHTYYFGIDPVIDSMKISLTFSAAIADTTQEMEISIYEVKGRHFYKDSTYYSNFNMSRYIGPTPLVTFKRKGKGLSVTHLPLEFANRLLDNRQNKENIYYSDTAFHSKFNGMYVTAKVFDQGKGCMIQADLSQSVMTLFYRSVNPETKLKDTTFQQFLFMGDYTIENVNFDMVKNDYSFADPSKGGVTQQEIGDTITQSKHCYVQGLGGLMGLIQIDTAAINRLKAEVKAKGYSYVALHRAELQVTTVDPSEDNFAQFFYRTALYYSMEGRQFLSEYNPILESANTGYYATIDGYLNRSMARYNYDITSYVQRLFSGSVKRSRTQLLPAYNLNADIARSVIYGSASEFPPKLILTYTMVK